MSKKKTRQDVIDTINNFLSGNQIQELYAQPFINWIGRTTDTNEYYTEVLSYELFKYLDDFNSMPVIMRNSSYKVDSHFPIQIDTTNRKEEIFAKRITGIEIDDLGKILDYQVPLKNKQDDKAGKIDLVSLNKERNTFHVVELKVEDNKETLLRAVLETYTYFKTVDRTRLLQDFNVDESVEVIPTVLVYDSENCKACCELEDMYMNGNRPMLKALSLAMGIEFYSINLGSCTRQYEL